MDVFKLIYNNYRHIFCKDGLMLGALRGGHTDVICTLLDQKEPHCFDRTGLITNIISRHSNFNIGLALLLAEHGYVSKSELLPHAQMYLKRNNIALIRRFIKLSDQSLAAMRVAVLEWPNFSALISTGDIDLIDELMRGNSKVKMPRYSIDHYPLTILELTNVESMLDRLKDTQQLLRLLHKVEEFLDIGEDQRELHRSKDINLIHKRTLEKIAKCRIEARTILESSYYWMSVRTDDERAKILAQDDEASASMSQMLEMFAILYNGYGLATGSFIEYIIQTQNYSMLCLLGSGGNETILSERGTLEQIIIMTHNPSSHLSSKVYHCMSHADRAEGLRILRFVNNIENRLRPEDSYPFTGSEEMFKFIMSDEFVLPLPLETRGCCQWYWNISEQA
ncbi:hypothetical protein SAMD00019534_114130 [Acytostelium subglobosum LB1]|uniref:hypothetical protein n=1 Tax=Acytostelium subglobosum LB1 TaxID=1410327 RepID=UPI000644FEB9|nr:hypothetical protein SAMD00019534_114130 [Acytostelium subglobosum LB1]GAM28237.1 hypothetical protein SAMD00019534_114130 [Acytostelium subglobosum LB1]|eukprot:XP_012748871.1 hypothetical protein SAMD00019534_114130 [Acytostelium subglobosum LB1]